MSTNSMNNQERGTLLIDLIREQYTVEELAELLKPLLQGESSGVRKESPVARKASPAEKKPVSQTRIAEVMKELGMPARLLGYKYIGQAIELGYNDWSKLQGVCKGLYFDLAKANHTTASRVERCIRHAIESTWDRITPQVMEKYFGNTISAEKGKPTNTEFLAQITNHMIREAE